MEDNSLRRDGETFRIFWMTNLEPGWGKSRLVIEICCWGINIQFLRRFPSLFDISHIAPDSP